MWGIRSVDGKTYAIGEWKDGVWFPGDRAMADTELQLLDEKGASVVWVDGE